VPGDPLVGRERELGEASARLARRDVRLLTLTGPPGVGKTRLAVEVTRAVRGRFDRTAFVDLVPLRDPSLLLGQVAHALQVRTARPGALLERLAGALRGRTVLLLLDNFEHLLQAAEAVGRLLEALPDLKVLATSREPLGLRWEHQMALDPLELPDLRNLPSPAHLAAVPSVALLLARATAVLPTFRINPANAHAVAEICVRLDGLPLALELAAPVLKVLSAQAVLERLDHRLSLLTRSARDLPERHRTLRAAVGWSYALLTPREQSAFRALSAFPGGWNVDAATAVCELERGEALDVIRGLVDKSLVRSQSVGVEPRFRMLDTIREFGLERLEAAGEREGVEARLAHHLLAVAERAGRALRGPEQGQWLAVLEEEHDNLRHVLEWSAQVGDHDTLRRLAASLWPFWNVRGHWAEGYSWTRAAAATADQAAQSERARLLCGGAVLAWRRRDYGAARQQAVEAARLGLRLGDRSLAAHALRTLGLVARDRGEWERASRLAGRSIVLCRESGDLHGLSSALRLMGLISIERCGFPEAREPFEESLALSQALQDARGVAWSLYGLSVVALAGSQPAAARSYAERCRQVFADLNDQDGVSTALNHLARIAWALGDLPQARALYEEALAIRRDLADPGRVASTLVELAGLAQAEQQKGEAARRYLEALRLYQEEFDPMGVVYAAEGLAILAARRGYATVAAHLLGYADAQRRAVHVSLDRPRIPGMPARSDLLETLGTVRSALAAGFEPAYAEGARTSLAWLVAEAAALTAAPERSSPRGGLSRREQQVAQLVSQGLTNREIAARLLVSERTVDTHVVHILNKLGFRSRAQIAAWAAQQGLTQASTAGGAPQPARS